MIRSITVTGNWLRYTPPAGFTNSDSFTYKVIDGRGGSATATVTVDIIDDTEPSGNLVIEDLGEGEHRPQSH